ncbi:N-acetyltransferase [Verminephrobacter aporrectodeae subsp. tuberculatae]|nr:GNAT family N-acetyltransferase [Verminephrobacter aporrectodeae]MCW5220462.1 N-acetyltransferase [Verminephrobacter aporrectodeae subsp. tuberculatae]MCW5255583.1 N-acetyltransferase [Verminephrobacter aporrectodeae subsp. tuberculatae]MCW5289758.1 N-acetyltransferase [Verminephrobacter aporrectodeae subsp. tuberculatae]MCW8167288.1 N-acetyltransferase [Verminephrobacter aporrectodeae subsp. tuberculatae]MCW8171535.1 N-acetyltransferase [Verminephrobacter aporrectodeae subsp. tuberculatae]
MDTSLLPGWINLDTMPGTFTTALALPDSCVVEAYDDFAFLRCPEREDFWFGNFVITRCPLPAVDDWPALHREWHRRIASRCAVPREVYQWECCSPAPLDEGKMATMGGDGLFTSLTVMQLRAALAFTLPQGVEFVELDTKQRFREAIVLTTESNAEDPESVATADFTQWQYGRQWEQVRTGRATWFGLLCQGRIVAHCGLIHKAGIGRYQDVTTAPAHRRQGLAEMLVRAVAAHALHRDRCHQLVIVAEADSPPERIYRRVGFEPFSHEYSVAFSREGQA